MSRVSGLCVLAALLAPAAIAQPRVLVDVPFDFYVGNELLAAGRYEFDRNVTGANSVIRLENRRGTVRLVSLVQGRRQGAYREAGLVFHRYGDNHFLKWVHWPSISLGLGTSRTEKERMITGALLQKVVVRAGVLRPLPNGRR